MRRLLLLALVALLVAGAVTARLFLFPAEREVARADAVVVFVGGKGERLETALAMMRRGVASNLVIPGGRRPTWPQANRLCRGGQAFTVHCPTPEPDTTRGEARAIGTLAASRDWNRVLLVTSTYHVTRARLLLSRCFDGRLEAVAADPGLAVPRHAARIAHEWAGLAEAELVNRGC